MNAESDDFIYRETLIYATHMLLIARRELSRSTITAMLTSAPSSVCEVNDGTHRKRSFCRNCLDEALEWAVDGNSSIAADLHDAAERHFLAVIPRLSQADRQRLVQRVISSIEA